MCLAAFSALYKQFQAQGDIFSKLFVQFCRNGISPEAYELPQALTFFLFFFWGGGW